MTRSEVVEKVLRRRQRQLNTHICTLLPAHITVAEADSLVCFLQELKVWMNQFSEDGNELACDAWLRLFWRACRQPNPDAALMLIGSGNTW